MGALLRELLTLWTKSGGGAFCHYAFISPANQHGYWGLLESMKHPGSPKWDAVIEAAVPAGDANLDGVVDSKDFAILKKNFGGARKFWEQGDFNHDGAVDGDDLAILKKNLKGLTTAQAAEVDALAKDNRPKAKPAAATRPASSKSATKTAPRKSR